MIVDAALYTVAAILLFNATLIACIAWAEFWTWVADR